MGILYYKCANCKLPNTNTNIALCHDSTLPESHKEDFDICDNCIEELFELEFANKCSVNEDESQIFYVKNIDSNTINTFTDVEVFMQHIAEEVKKGNKVEFDVRYVDEDVDCLTFDALETFYEWCPKKEIWKKRERERIGNNYEIDSLEKKRKMLETLLFI